MSVSFFCVCVNILQILELLKIGQVFMSVCSACEIFLLHFLKGANRNISKRGGGQELKWRHAEAIKIDELCSHLWYCVGY